MASAAQIAKELAAAVSAMVADAMLRAHAAVTAATPKDTTHAASNWLLSVGHPRTEVVGSRQSVDWSQWSAGRDELVRYDIKQGRVYLRNNVPYIGALNHGWSKQASAGFVERAISGAGSQALPAGQKRSGAKILRKLATSSIRRGGRTRGFRGVNSRDLRGT